MKQIFKIRFIFFVILCSFINYRENYCKEFRNTSKFKSNVLGISLTVNLFLTVIELYFSNEHITKKHNAQNNVSDQLPSILRKFNST